MKVWAPMVAIAAVSCQPGKPSSHGDNRRFQTKSDMSVTVLPYDKADMIFAGTRVPVDFKVLVEGDKLLFTAQAHGEVVEEEHYFADANGLRLAGVTGESFDPPIPVVRFPMTVGDKWEWTGESVLGTISKPATAEIDTSDEKLNLRAGVFDTVLVRVELKVSDNGTPAAKRVLKFWIDPKKGIVRREFGFGSAREPRASAEAEK